MAQSENHKSSMRSSFAAAAGTILLCFSITAAAQDWHPICVSCIPHYTGPSQPPPHPRPRNNQQYTPSPQALAASWRSAGVQAYNNGDWNSAINDFGQALQYTPNDSNLQHWLYQAQQQQAQAQAAEAAAAREQQLEAEEQAQQNAKQQAQTDAENQAQSLQNTADEIAAAQQADAQDDWQDAYDYWSYVLSNAPGNAASEEAMQRDSDKMDQAFAVQRDHAAQLLKSGGGGTDLGLLRGVTVSGSSSALAQLRGTAATGKAAAVASSPAEAKSASNLGFDTAGATESGAYEYRVTTTAFQSVPAATRNNPQFQGMIQQVAELNGERSQVQMQEAQVKQELASNPSPQKQGDLQVTLSNLKQTETDIYNKEAAVVINNEQNLHFNVNVNGVIAAISATPVTTAKPITKASQAVAKREPK